MCSCQSGTASSARRTRDGRDLNTKDLKREQIKRKMEMRLSKCRIVVFSPLHEDSNSAEVTQQDCECQTAFGHSKRKRIQTKKYKPQCDLYFYQYVRFVIMLLLWKFSFKFSWELFLCTFVPFSSPHIFNLVLSCPR